jgi:hypothetical protein
MYINVSVGGSVVDSHWIQCGSEPRVLMTKNCKILELKKILFLG